jgi:hypothetical protein
MGEHTPTPWAYRSSPHDDWGWIRGPKTNDGIAPLVAMARSGVWENVGMLDEHRRNKTDPYGANAAFIVKAVNSYQAMQDILIDVWFYFSDSDDPKFRKMADAARALIPDPVGGPANG